MRFLLNSTRSLIETVVSTIVYLVVIVGLYAFAICGLILAPRRFRAWMRSSAASAQRTLTDIKLEAIHLRQGVRDPMPGAY